MNGVYFNERAGILEYDNGLSRTDAEAVAFQDCVGELLNHNPTSHAGCSTDEAWRAAAIAALNAAGAAPSCHNGDPP